MAMMAIPMLVAAAATSAYASYSAQHYQSQVASNNAVLAAENEKNIQSSGQAAVTNVDFQNAGQAGMIKATIAANGLDVNGGTAENVEGSQAITGQLNRETTQSNTARQAQNAGNQVTNYDNNATMYQQGADFSAISAPLKMAAAAYSSPQGSAVTGQANAVSDATAVAPQWQAGFQPKIMDSSINA